MPSLPLFCQSSPNHLPFIDEFRRVAPHDEFQGSNGWDAPTSTAVGQQQWITNASSCHCPPNETNTFSFCRLFIPCVFYPQGGKWGNARRKNLFCSNLHVLVRPSMHSQTSKCQAYGMQREWRVWILRYIQIAARKCREHLIPDSQAVLHIHLIEMCAYIPNEQFSLISKKLSL